MNGIIFIINVFSGQSETIAGTSGAKASVHEESPGSIGQGAGQFPVKATLRKVQQKRKPPLRGKDEKAR